MRMYVLIIVTFVLWTGSLMAQFDGPTERSWTRPLNFGNDTTIFVDADSALAFVLPAGAVIERVYWRVDSATTSVDSVQLRSSASQVVVSTFIPGIDGVPEIQHRDPMHKAVADETLYFVGYLQAGPAGQIRILAKYQEIY